MGVKLLTTFLKETNLVITGNIKRIANYKLLMDGNNLMYHIYGKVQKRLNDAKSPKTVPFTNSTEFSANERVVCSTLVNVFAEYISPILSHGLSMTIVMDGKAPKEKLQSFYRSPSGEKTNRRKRGVFRNISDDQVFDCKAMFVDTALMMGLKVMYASGEAEAACTAACNQGYGDAVLSKDSDCVAMGCREIILTVDYPHITYVTLTNILNKLKISKEQLMEMCILCGNDYNYRGDQNITPNYAYQLIKSYHWIKNIPSHMIDCKHMRVEECRRIYNKGSRGSDEFSFGSQGKRMEMFKPENPKYSIWSRNEEVLAELGLKEHNRVAMRNIVKKNDNIKFVGRRTPGMQINVAWTQFHVPTMR